MIETTIVYPLKRLTAFRDEGYISLGRALVTFIIGVVSLTESELVHI